MYDILKQDLEQFSAIAPEGFHCNFYWKDQEITWLNRWSAMIPQLLVGPMDKTTLYDLIWPEETLMNAHYDIQSKSIVLGKNIDAKLSELNLSYADKIRFSLFHELGHAVFDFFGLELHNKLKSEMYADSFAVYMSTADCPDKFLPLMAQVVAWRHKATEMQSGPGNDFIYEVEEALVHFAGNRPQSHQIAQIHQRIMESVNYGVAKIEHYKSLHQEKNSSEYDNQLNSLDVQDNLYKYECYIQHKNSFEMQDASYWVDFSEPRETLIPLLSEMMSNKRANLRTKEFIKMYLETVQICEDIVKENTKFIELVNSYAVRLINTVYYMPKKAVRI